MQKRTFQASYDTVFYSVRSVLQDHGYIIKSQDYQGGMISASKSMTNEVTTEEVVAVVGLSLLGVDTEDYPRKLLDKFSLSVSFDKISKNTVGTRMTIQHSAKDNYGGEEGSEVLDPKLYYGVYNQISSEIKKRSMMSQMKNAKDETPLSLNSNTDDSVELVKIKGKKAIIKTAHKIKNKEIYLNNYKAEVLQTKDKHSVVKFKTIVPFSKTEKIILRLPTSAK